MYISKVSVRNFRVFDQKGITAHFRKGVNAVIGENNCGKTALIDAIRIAFSTVPYKKDIYFGLSDFHVDISGARCNEAQIDVYLDEVPADFFEIWDPEDMTKGEFHIKYFAVKVAGGKEKVRYSIWGGPVEGNPVSAETFEAMQLVFLGALRDAETELRPTRTSKLASLLGTIAFADEMRDDLVSIFQEANTKLLGHPSIQRVDEIINTNLATIEQDVMQQKISLGLVEPKFDSIAASLRAWLKPRWFYLQNTNPQFEALKESLSVEEWVKHTEEDEDGAYLDVHQLLAMRESSLPEVQNLLTSLADNSLDLFQNGLGYNNILFMSVILGDISSEAQDILYSLLLVEEPEAHLHPQLQGLVHSFFEKNATKDRIQVIYTSHSPTLVARIGIDKIVLLFENNHRVNCLSLSRSNLDEADKDYLERYLDVTKSQMLFAKGIIFVEGICEALLIPVMASLLDRPLDRYAVEVVNIDGVAFRPFVNLLSYAQSTDVTTVKAAIVTDDDRCSDRNNPDDYIPKDCDFDTEELACIVKRLKSDVPSARFEKINRQCENTHIGVFSAAKTFEYAVALEESNIPYILDAITTAHPQVGKSLADRVNGLTTTAEKAACIWLFMQYRSKSKGEIAQILAGTLASQLIGRSSPDKTPGEKSFIVPSYIKGAIFAVTRGDH